MGQGFERVMANCVIKEPVYNHSIHRKNNWVKPPPPNYTSRLHLLNRKSKSVSFENDNVFFAGRIIGRGRNYFHNSEKKKVGRTNDFQQGPPPNARDSDAIIDGFFVFFFLHCLSDGLVLML